MIDPADLYWKAEQALETERAVLELGDANTAAGRAYYAMFNAARATLAVRTGNDPALVKTHSGLIRRFSELFVKTGLLDVDLGRALAVAFEDRATADYDGLSVSLTDAERDLDAAVKFVAACRVLTDRPKP